MGKHTPGPWIVRGNSICVDETDDRLAMHVKIHGGNRDDNKANARLIASAPDLLAALASMVEAHAVPSSICKERPAYEAACAAIAKATGRAAISKEPAK